MAPGVIPVIVAVALGVTLIAKSVWSTPVTVSLNVTVIRALVGVIDAASSTKLVIEGGVTSGWPAAGSAKAINPNRGRKTLRRSEWLWLGKLECRPRTSGGVSRARALRQYSDHFFVYNII